MVQEVASEMRRERDASQPIWGADSVAELISNCSGLVWVASECPGCMTAGPANNSRVGNMVPGAGVGLLGSDWVALSDLCALPGGPAKKGGVGLAYKVHEQQHVD